MAATASFDELPAPLASTRQTVRCTVTKSLNESRLLAIKVPSESDSQPEEELAADATFGEEKKPSYMTYGDPFSRLKWLYDGTLGQHPGVWKNNP